MLQIYRVVILQTLPLLKLSDQQQTACCQQYASDVNFFKQRKPGKGTRGGGNKYRNLQVVLFTDGGKAIACRCQYLYCIIVTLLSGYPPKGINFTYMSAHFRTITEESKPELAKPVHTDMVNYCELKNWYGVDSFRSFSIKYVIENFIYYKVGKKELLLKSGDFILACKKPYVKSYFEGEKTTKDLCININEETVKEAFTIISAKENYQFDDYLAKYFENPVFFESVCPARSAPGINQKLQNLVENINAGKADHIVNKEWFFDLVEKMIYYEYGNYLALNGIHSVKTETKKEILQRLKIAKDYMDDCFLQIEDINEVARACNLSAFHFFRSFKQAYLISPYQYLLQKRLEFGRSMLTVKNTSINKIALQCNFADLPTFSKAFKRQFGVAPSQYLQAG